MAVEGRTVVRSAALSAVDKRQRTFKARGREIRTERLAGVGGIDHQRRAGKVLQLVVLGIDPRRDALLIFERYLGDGLDGQS
jgi:hypothetical protein